MPAQGLAPRGQRHVARRGRHVRSWKADIPVCTAHVREIIASSFVEEASLTSSYLHF